MSLSRIRDRVAHGGHNIPEPDVRRRFKRGLMNFFKLYRSLVDSWFLIDNSSENPTLIAIENDGILKIKEQSLFDRIVKGID